MFAPTMLVLLASLLLGGGTRDGFVSDAALESIALLSLGWMVYKAPLADLPRTTVVPILTFIGLATALYALQLLPGISGSSTTAALRNAVSEATGVAVARSPLSVAPYLTWQAALSLIVPFAVFLGTACTTAAERRLLSMLIVVFAVFSAGLGIVQITQGYESALRFYVVTNADDAVGFFANRNHFSALLYCGLVFGSVWVANVLASTGGRLTRTSATEREKQSTLLSLDTHSTLLIALPMMLLFLIVGQIQTRSRAGLLITILILGGLVSFILRRPRATAGDPDAAHTGLSLAQMGLLATLAFAVLYGLDANFPRVLNRFTSDQLQDIRFVYMRTTIEAARAFLPFGSGMGTFATVYGSFSRSSDEIISYANRAHNDFVEFFLEAGVVAIIIITVFLVWLIAASRSAFNRPAAAEPPLVSGDGDWRMLVERALPLAGFAIVLLLLLHSIVDYPLRTGGLAAVFAFACGLLLPPWPSVATVAGQAPAARHHRHRRRSSDRSTDRPAAAAMADVSAPQPASPQAAVRPPRPDFSASRVDPQAPILGAAPPSAPQAPPNWPQEWQPSPHRPSPPGMPPVPPTKPGSGSNR